MTVVWMVILVGLPLCRWLANKNRRLRTQLEEQRLLFSQMDLESFSPEEEFSPKAHDLAGDLTGEEKRSPGEGLCLDRRMRKVYRGKGSGSGLPGRDPVEETRIKTGKKRLLFRCKPGAPSCNRRGFPVQ